MSKETAIHSSINQERGTKFIFLTQKQEKLFRYNKSKRKLAQIE